MARNPRTPTMPRPSILILVSSLILPPALPQEVARVSSFGRYEGWSVERFDGWTTTSLYVPMRDGVRLAVDVTRPTTGGVATDEPLPVVWTHSRYHRNPGALAQRFGGSSDREIRSNVDGDAALQRLVRHGYVVCAAGVRGSGASFGRFEGLFSEAETKDAAELVAWFAAQPWCDGNVGMYGGSYLGITQYMAASLAPPALKAIFPEVAAFDLYELLYPGGVFREDLMEHWDRLTDLLDTEWHAPPVDGEEGEALLAQAVAEHEGNWQVLDGYRSAPCRDDAVPGLDWSQHGPAPFLAGINRSQVAIYHANGWFDVFALDTCLWFRNYRGPQRVMMGPWSHAQAEVERGRLREVEQHRWFDRWLKGIENGVEEEPPFQWALMKEPGEVEWRASRTWPPEEVAPQELLLAAGPSETVESANDGLLAFEADAEAGADEYAIDPTTTTGSSSRWDNAVGAAPLGMSYSGLAENDRKSLTYTSRALEADLAVVGHPVLHLYVTATAGDADFVVLLEEVDVAGSVRYVSEGVLRGSQRKLGSAPYDNLGLPWQRCFAADREPLPSDEPVELVLDLHPTATVFDAGHRVRLSICCADADNLEAPRIELPASVTVHRGGARSSRLVLPVLGATAGR